MAEQLATEQAQIAAKAKAERATAELRKADLLSEAERANAEIEAARKHQEARDELAKIEAARLAALEEQHRKGTCAWLWSSVCMYVDCLLS